METPNTRYRRKREDETIGNGNGTPRSGNASGSQDQDRVIWVHDQRLKRAVQMASENGTLPPSLRCLTIKKGTNGVVELAPPTPTQKPRSICSSRPSDTSRPRKRPCRQSRSAPTPLSSAGVGGSGTAQSTSTGDVGLEMLLQRFELFNSTTTSSLGSGTSTPGKGKGRDMGLDRGVSSPITRSASTARVNHNSASLVQSENQRNLPTKDILATKQIAPSPLSNRTNITSNPTHSINTKPTTRPQQPRTHAGKPKPFKTPFLNPPTIRSSPRRTVPPSPLRALPVQTPTRPKIHNANVDIGEDEEGNDSFDSFDGMFQEGGPEIDELFRAVDGS